MKWKKLQHNGILFPPEYEKQGIKIKIQGDTIDLDINQEEMVYQWAKKKDTPYAQDKVFQKNFTGDFVKTCLLYTSPSPRDQRGSRMPSSA